MIRSTCASLISAPASGTVKVNGQEPYTWLRHVLERLSQTSSVEDYEVLLPWNCSPEMSR
jgi:hypothetical protein